VNDLQRRLPRKVSLYPSFCFTTLAVICIGIASGCDDYVSKPVDPEEILKKIDKWMVKG